MSSLNIGLSQLPDVNLDSKLYTALTAIHLAIGSLVQQVSELTGIDSYPETVWGQLTPATTLITGNSTRMYLPASTNLTAGQIVNLHSNAGVLNARPARADTAATMAHGMVTQSSLAGEIASINFLRTYTDLIGGLAVGALYYLSPTTAGSITNVRPTSAGHIIQPIGLGLTSSTFAMDIPLSYIQL